MTDKDLTIEEAIWWLERTANFLRGMLLDPNIPDYVKEAIRDEVSRVDSAVNKLLEDI